MADRAAIANLALVKLGTGQKVTSLTDNSVAARALYAVYDLTRLALLRRHNWSFSIKRTTLPASATAPTWGYSQAYPLPADYIRLVQANEFYLTPSLLDYNTADASAYAIEVDDSGTQRICCDYSAPLKIRYVYDVTDEGLFDPLFVHALAAKLAYEVCEQLTNSSTKKQDMMGDYKMAVADAVRTNAIEKPPALIGDDSWIMARL